MNTKLVRCATLVMTLCLMSSLASAQGFKIKPVPKGRVSTKSFNSKMTLNPLSKVPMETIDTSIPDIADMSLNENFDAEMDTLAANIAKTLEDGDITDAQNPFGTFTSAVPQEIPLTVRDTVEDWMSQNWLYQLGDPRETNQLIANLYGSMNRNPNYMMSNQLKQILSNVYQSRDDHGTLLSRKIGFRDVYVFDQDPSITHLLGTRLSQLFDGVEIFHVLNTMLGSITATNSTYYGAEFSGIVANTYAAMARGQIQEWNLEKAIQAPLQQFAAQEDLSAEYAPAFFPEGRATEMPEWAPVSWAISFTEYQLQNNKGKFPTLGLNPDLDVMIMGLWNKMIERDLDLPLLYLLVDDYLYTTDIQDIDEVIDESLHFFETHGRWPGVSLFAGRKMEARDFAERMQAGKLTQAEIEEVELGQKLLLLVEAMPDEYMNKLPKETQETLRQIADKMETEFFMQLGGYHP